MRNLRTEDEIIANWKSDIDKPVVSICCITYNHELYIEDALEGFLIQQTDFPFEILIHDDASTDRTADVIREYEAEYPRLIKPIYQTENQYSKGLKMNPTFNFPRAKGEYIALCEGDDYWTKRNKLETQKKFLDENQEFGFCFHKVKQLNQVVSKNSYSAYVENTKKIVKAKDVIMNHFIPTLSLFYRNKLVMRFLPQIHGDFRSGDIFIEVILSTQSLGYFFDEEMGVYRHHDSSLTKTELNPTNIIKVTSNYKELYKKLMEVTPKDFHKEISIIKLLRVEYLLLRSFLQQGYWYRAIGLAYKMFLTTPTWPIIIIKRRFSNGVI